MRGHDKRPDWHPPDSCLRRSWLERGRRGWAARRYRHLRPARRHLAGWLSDRWDNRLLLCAYYGFRGLSLLYLPFAFDMSIYGLPVFSVVYGLDWIASAPPTVRLLTGVVGPERIGIMVAWITVIHQVGSASAAYLAGVLRIAFGTYLEAFVLSGVLLIAAAIMVLFVGAGSRLKRQETVAAAPL